jgi:hypothetical protein
MTPKQRATKASAERQKALGKKAIGVSMDAPYVALIEHLRATTPGGFNLNAFLRGKLKELAIQQGYPIELP